MLPAILAFLLMHVPSARHDGVDEVRRWARERLALAEANFIGSRMPSPESGESQFRWDDEVAYFVLIDRFNNGEPSNDRENLRADQLRYQDTGFLDGIRRYHHGGDLRGVTERLEYLVDLGVTVVVLSPLMGHNGDYHGYCTTDPATVDPSFGTAADLHELVRAAHALGLRVILDLGVNHICGAPPGNTTQHAPMDPAACVNAYLAHDRRLSGVDEDAVGNLEFQSDFFPPFDAERFFHRCGRELISSGAGRRFADLPPQYNREESIRKLHYEAANFARAPGPIYAFARGDHASGESDPNFLFDYNTNDPDFQEVFTHLMQWWIVEFDVDGFHLQAVPHVTQAFIARFSTRVRGYAASLGKRNFHVVGQIFYENIGEAVQYQGDMNAPEAGADGWIWGAAMTEAARDLRPLYTNFTFDAFPGLTAFYDLGARTRLTDLIANEFTPSEMRRYEIRPDIPQILCPYCWQAIDMHTHRRFASRYDTGAAADTTGDGSTGYARAAAMLRGVAPVAHLLLSSFGVPVLYYGMEQGLTGRCSAEQAHAVARPCAGAATDDAYVRQDLFVSGPFKLGSLVPQLAEQAGIVPPGARPYANPEWWRDPMLPRGHLIYTTTRRLLHLRRSCIALRRGYVDRHASEDDLVDSEHANPLHIFSRVYVDHTQSQLSGLGGQGGLGAVDSTAREQQAARRLSGDAASSELPPPVRVALVVIARVDHLKRSAVERTELPIMPGRAAGGSLRERSQPAAECHLLQTNARIVQGGAIPRAVAAAEWASRAGAGRSSRLRARRRARSIRRFTEDDTATRRRPTPHGTDSPPRDCSRR